MRTECRGGRHQPRPSPTSRRLCAVPALFPKGGIVGLVGHLPRARCAVVHRRRRRNDGGVLRHRRVRDLKQNVRRRHPGRGHAAVLRATRCRGHRAAGVACASVEGVPPAKAELGKGQWVNFGMVKCAKPDNSPTAPCPPRLQPAAQAGIRRLLALRGRHRLAERRRPGQALNQRDPGYFSRISCGSSPRLKIAPRVRSRAASSRARSASPSAPSPARPINVDTGATRTGNAWYGVTTVGT